MNLILFEDAQEQARLPVRDPRLEHVRGVLRMREGDSFDVGVINGPRGKARIDRIGETFMELSFDWGLRPPLPPDITMLMGLSRPQTCRRILQEATTMGVRALHFAPAGKSDPAFAQSRLWTDGEAERYLRQGAEQAFDTFLPALHLHESLSTALEHVSAAQLPSAQRCALDVYKTTADLRQTLTRSAPVVLCIGPERGWNGPDRALLREAGFALVHLGERVLRVETAAVAALTLAHAALAR